MDAVNNSAFSEKKRGAAMLAVLVGGRLPILQNDANRCNRVAANRLVFNLGSVAMKNGEASIACFFVGNHTPGQPVLAVGLGCAVFVQLDDGKARTIFFFYQF